MQSGVFDAILVPDELKGCLMKQSLVGQSKTNLNVIGANDSIAGVSSIFGNFFKFIVEVQEPINQDCSLSVPRRNAFEVMAAAQRELDAIEKRGVPIPVQQRTKKDKLFNDLIELVVELKLKWRSPRTDCTPFLKKLTNLLWYIDGHHGTIAEKSSAIPDIFSPFQGYNCPEVSKHRKRAKDNLKREELESYSLFLQEAIHASWMQPFKEFRSSVEGLRDSLCGYTSYLLSKSKYQRLHHLMKDRAIR